MDPVMIDHLVVQKPKAFGAAATSLKTRERVKGCRVLGDYLMDRKGNMTSCDFTC